MNEVNKLSIQPNEYNKIPTRKLVVKIVIINSNNSMACIRKLQYIYLDKKIISIYLIFFTKYLFFGII